MTRAPFRWEDAGVRRALGLEGVVEARPLEFSRVSTDTRTLPEGALFVALEGERFDGHDYLDAAAARGARAAVVSDSDAVDGPLPTYPVRDTLVALGQLARFRRRALTGSVVALTGSSGKTTVKELLRAGLGAEHRVHATPANLNNRVGLPLTLLDAPDDAEWVVVELGTNEPGEIGILTRIAEPDAALITTVSEAHLEGLGGLEGVLDEKLDLLVHLRPGAPAMVGDRPPSLAARARAIREGVSVAGFTEEADPEFRGEPGPLDADGRMTFRYRDQEVHPRLPGRHGAVNVLLALALMHRLEVPLAPAVPALERVEPRGFRGEWRQVGAMRLILDCYNANPQSVRAALELLASLPGSEPRVAVLGSMLELGEQSRDLHRAVLQEALELPLTLVMAVGVFHEVSGELDGSAHAGSRLLSAPDLDEGWATLRPWLDGRETVLLKGSRGMAMERLVPRFQEAFGSGEEN